MTRNFLYKSITYLFAAFHVFCIPLYAQPFFEKNDSSVTILTSQGSHRIQIFTDKIIRVIHSPSKTIKPDTSLCVKFPRDKTSFNVAREENKIKVSTKSLLIQVNVQTGAVSVSDNLGIPIFKEKYDPVLFTPAEILSEKTYNAQLNLQLSPGEAVYGLGQFQNGIMNYRGHNLTLVQENTQIALPFLVSTNKYGLMFDNYSKIKFHDKNDSTYFWFEVADIIDYYFIAGKDMDEVIKGYRNLTGKVPMLPKWAYGYWQSKERYKSQEEILAVVEEFRERKIPVDNIIQDWQYWGDDWAYWNAMRFDSTRYPNPEKMINILHELNIHLMISVWPVVGQKTELYKKLDSKGLLFAPYHWTDGRTYDAYNKEARNYYWSELNKGLFSKGVDGFWMDATEPEVVLAPHERSIKEAQYNSLGTMARYLNPYSYLTTGAVFEGQRSVTSKKRVCTLTRSAFLGQQRYATIAWSGDIIADWNVYRKQISAGLNFCMSGIPYWTNDIGGFHVNRYGGFPGGCINPGYRELYVRWFQFGVFNSIFRSHGTDTPREPWQFGEKGDWAYNTILKYINLRYRLLPYIYSLALQITNQDYTLMRALPMDFPDDLKVYNINDQFMFGPSILVNPVTEHMYFGESYLNEIIPPQNLQTPDGIKDGFRAQYFNGTNFDTLMVDSLQTELLFDLFLGKDLPPQVNWERNCIRWSGSILTKKEGDYEFWLTTDDAVRLFIDEKQIIEVWNDKGKDTTFRIIIALEAAKWYSFKVEYSRKANASKLRFAWRTPDMISKKFNSEKEYGSRPVYLPNVIGGWYDFWTGEHLKSSQTIQRDVPIDIIPLYVKAGSIIPIGPVQQYASEKLTEPIDLRIYCGAEAEFDLYEDEGDSYAYEQEVYSVIPIKWSEKEQILSIGNRKGSFPGMLKNRIFNIYWIDQDKGTGINREDPDSTINYNGNLISIKKQL